MSKIRERILEFMRCDTYKPMTGEEIAASFGIDKGQYREFNRILAGMEKEGLVFKTKKERYGLPQNMNLVIGRLQGNAKGFGFVIPDSGVEDVYISPENMNGAMNNDTVVAKVTKKNAGKKIEGEIVRIIERANKTIVGTLEKNKNFGFVVPDDQRIYQDIFISKGDMATAKNGYKVVVEVTKWPEKRRNPEGKIVEVLGNAETPGVDILSIIRKYDLPEEFPANVVKFVNEIQESIPDSEYKRRRDLRDLKIVTIDGEDAKDLDDAISIERLEGGKFKLGVHIADVSYYVREKSPLDKEAFKRGTSVYLVDRVIPMLPKKLSNGLCSLNPNVDRLTLTCMMVINSKGKVESHEIFESIIRTSERMTYTDVTKILNETDKEVMERYDYLIDDFKAMKELCLILNERRNVRGALDFEFDESKIILDEKGKPIDIRPYEREIANRVIEEFMLVCNETIAEHMFFEKLPFIYRIHEDPDNERLQAFSEFVYNLGYHLKVSDDIKTIELQRLLNEAKGTKEQSVIDTLLLRSLKQAKYSPICSGHFGLAAKYYCHFTSPIRRYPDLAIHRIIKEYLRGKIEDKRYAKLTGFVESASGQSSDRERLAQEAERDTDDLKKVEYMSERVGNVYPGIISSVTSFGMFVTLPNTVEGLIRISNLYDDYYVYDDKLHSLIGEKTRKIYRLGDPVSVRVIKADMVAKTIDFVLDDGKEESSEEN